MGEKLFNSSVKFLERTWYQGYLEYMSGVDIVLHPFPFGGSKTSIDALIVGVYIYIYIDYIYYYLETFCYMASTIFKRQNGTCLLSYDKSNRIV